MILHDITRLPVRRFCHRADEYGCTRYLLVIAARQDDAPPPVEFVAPCAVGVRCIQFAANVPKSAT
jgi:hypothetical protein